MKKQTAVLLAAAIISASAALAACGSGNSASSGDQTTVSDQPSGEQGGAEAAAGETGESVTLDFTWWGNQVRNERTEAACAAYSEAHPEVAFRTVPINSKEYFDKVTTLAAGNEMPDILQQDYEKLNRYVEKGVHENMDVYVEDGTIDLSAIPETFLQNGKVDDSYYAFSMGVNAPCLVYDKTLLDELGLEVSQKMTWDEFNELAKEVYEKSGAKTTYSTLLGPQHQIRISVRNAGKHVYSEDGTGLGFDDANLVARVFALMENSIKEGYGLSGEGYTGIQTVEQCPIVSGQAWNEFIYSNQVVALQEAMGDRELGITMNPEFADASAPGAFVKPSVMIAMGSQGTEAEKRESAEFIDYILNSVECNEILLGERGVPINSDVRTAIYDQVDEVTQKTFDFIDMVAENSSDPEPIDPPAGQEIDTNALRIRDEVLYGKKTAEEAAQVWMETAQKLLRE